MSIVAEVYWRSKELSSIEHFRLIKKQQQWHLRGEVNSTARDEKTHWIYHIVCDEHWLTQKVALQSSAMPPLSLTCDGDQKWYRDRVHVPHLDGVQDIDLGFTPSTNTLPIRRQQPTVGESIICRAAWFRPDDASIVPVEQHYTRLRHQLFECRNSSSGFQAQLSVDEHSVVRDYGDIWFAESAAR